MASAVFAADRLELARVEERAGRRGSDANHAEDAGFCYVAGAVGCCEHADGLWIVECGEVQFCWWFDDLGYRKL